MQVKKLFTLLAFLGIAATSMAEVTYTTLNNIANDRDSETAAMLLDGRTDTKWCKGISDATPDWIIFKTSEAINPVGYVLTEANDTPGNQGRQWKQWKIYGGTFADDATATAATSIDGWTLLDQKTDIDNVAFPISASNNTYKETRFAMSESNSTAYTYFKIVVEKVRSGNTMQMADFCFQTLTFNPVTTFTCTGGSKYNNTSESCDKAFDGNVSTKWYEGNPGDNGRYALFQASQPIYVWGYDIITANDTETRGRLPKQVILKGATTNLAYDSEDWVTLCNYENDYIQQLNYHTQRFFLSDKEMTKDAYQYFKLEIPKPNNSDIQISEFKLCYETQPVVTYTWSASTGDETSSKKAVDLLIGQKWEAGSNGLSGKSLTIKTDDDASHAVKSYSFSTQDDGSWNNRAPKTWKVEGSDDNSNWVTIHEVTDADVVSRNPIKNINYTTFEFTPSNTDAFKYIKLTLNSMKGTGHTQLGEFHVVGGCTSHLWMYMETVDATCTSQGGYEYVCPLCGVRKVENATDKIAHSYVDGFCSVCGIIQPDYMTPVNNYYEASTAHHLKWLATRMDEKEDGNFKVKLTQDIDLKDSGFKGFSIGNSGIKYKGEFDGQGHWLKNLDISSGDLKQVGLFGQTENAHLHDFGMVKANVKLSAYYTQNTGIIVGNANSTTINRVAVMYGSYVQGYDHVGSIAGNTQGSTTISNCLSDADVVSNSQTGGLVGTATQLTLEKNLFLGSVKCKNDGEDAGGFISRLENNNAKTIRNNIMAATGLTTAQQSTITPLVNPKDKGESATFSKNYVAASTIFKSTHGSAEDDLKEGTTMSFDDLNGSNGKTTAVEDMQTANFYTSTMGWDMTNDWTFYAEGHYPVLKWMVVNISDADELMEFASNVNSGMTDLVAQLTGAINMSGVAYTPIGTEANKYAGSFDGKGNVVSNISYTSSTQDHVGLFGYIKNATIQNTVLDGATITVTTKQNTGGLVGTASASTIQKCAVVNSTITGHDHVAAIVANAIDGTEVRNNYSDAAIISDQYQAGGLVGTIKVATIEKNLFVGTVSNPTGDASGLISRIDASVSPNPIVRNNMVAAPTITGSSTYAIIKADFNDRPVTFADNYTLKSTIYSTGGKTLTNKDDRNGLQISWIDATTKDFYETTLGWDFENTWKFTCGGKYPILKIMADEAPPTQDVTVTSAGYATMVAQYDYDFTSAPVETYAVTESATEGYVHLEPVTSAKHGEALLLKGGTDTYTLTATAAAKDVTAENLLKAADEDVVSNGTLYALAKKNDVVGFYQVGTAESAVTIPAGKAYLDGVPSSVKAYIFDFDDDPDAISSLLASPEEEGQVYNLAGQRILKMQRGVNIINGKKILK